MPPAERNLYWEYYKKDMREKAKAEKGQTKDIPSGISPLETMNG